MSIISMGWSSEAE